MKKLRLLKLTPHESIKEIEIDDSLEALQKEVGGYIEIVPISPTEILIVNEEGKLKNLDLCLAVKYKDRVEYLVGNVLFAKRWGEDICSVDKDTLDCLLKDDLFTMFRLFDAR